MRTTVDIPDQAYRSLKTRAVAEGTTVKELVLRGVEGVLSKETVRPARRLNLPLIDSDTPGTLLLDNERIYDLIGFP